MAKLRFFNFLTKKVEDFTPIKSPVVTLYTCGPTVYDFVHIGNWRTFIFEDILRRTLEFADFQVKHIMNITDIDDKIIAAARDARLETREFVKPYETAFFEDLEKLNIKKAHFYPAAIEHIKDMIQLIEKLLDRGAAYKTDDGIYFDISKFGKYGKLSNLGKMTIKVGARIAADLYDKENPADFALWKLKKPGEPSWPAPFGDGRPGWHIECSAMSMKYLGEHIDIHTGGVDLLFPHHENEIAQSEAATGKNFVNYLLEGEHMLLSGQKISKSLGNIITLEDLDKKHFDPQAFRYLCLTAHYRSKLNFTWESLTAAANALNNLRIEIANWDEAKIGHSDSESLQTRMRYAEFEQKFREAVFNDLDTPKALAIMHEMIDSNYPTSAKKASILVMDQILGLELSKIKKAKLSKEAKTLIEKREKLRAKGDFAQADKIRQQLKKMGVEIEDTPKGPKIKIKN